MNLAMVQGQRLKIADADRNFREAVETAERIYGPDHDVYLKNIYLYGMFLERFGQAHKAIPLLRQAVETVRRTKGEDETFLNSILLSGSRGRAGRSRIAGRRRADACTRDRAKQGGWFQRPQFCAGDFKWPLERRLRAVTSRWPPLASTKRAPSLPAMTHRPAGSSQRETRSDAHASRCAQTAHRKPSNG